MPVNSRFKYIKEDITNPETFEKAIKENKIDIVLYLACISNDPTYELNSELSKINFECFEDLVKISKRNNVKNLFMHQPVQCTASQIIQMFMKRMN